MGPHTSHNPLRSRLLYFSLILLGFIIILISSLFQQVPLPNNSATFFTFFLVKNFTFLPKLLFVISAFLTAYFTPLKPLLTGICLILIFPVTAIVEVILNSQTHNLLGIEFVIYLGYGIPSIIAAFTAKLLRKLTDKINNTHQPTPS